VTMKQEATDLLTDLGQVNAPKEPKSISNARATHTKDTTTR